MPLRVTRFRGSGSEISFKMRSSSAQVPTPRHVPPRRSTGPPNLAVGSDGKAIFSQCAKAGGDLKGARSRRPRTRSKGAQDVVAQCFGTDSHLAPPWCDRSLGLCGRESPYQTRNSRGFLEWVPHRGHASCVVLRLSSLEYRVHPALPHDPGPSRLVEADSQMRRRIVFILGLVFLTPITWVGARRGNDPLR